jgi:hypothetical protein
VLVTARLRDDRFIGVNDATVRAKVTGPDGRVTEMPLAFAVDRDGEYTATFTAGQDGLYDIAVDAATRAKGSDSLAAQRLAKESDPLAHARAFVRAAPDDREYFDAAMRPAFLRRVAEDTGGRFYTPATASTLPEDITYLGRGVTVVQEKDLWDMPAVLVLLIGLAGGEWLLRRRWGLA